MNKPKDLNEKRMQTKNKDFYKSLLKNATPMAMIEPDEKIEETTRDGWVKIREIVEYCLAKQDNIQDCITHISSHGGMVDDLGQAYLDFPDEIDVEFLRLRSITGLSGASDSLKRLVRKEARTIKAKERKDKVLNSLKNRRSFGEEPNEYTVEKLQKTYKRIGDDYVVTGYKSTLLNLDTIFRTDPKWAGRICWSLLHQRTLIDGEPIKNIDLTRIQLWIAKVYGIEYKDVKKTLNAILTSVAQDNKIHPVQEWLDSLRWDGKHRLKDLARDVFNSPDAGTMNQVGGIGEYKKSFGIEGVATFPQIAIIRAFIAAVARACDPGCKVDWMPILISTFQGAHKSTSIEALCNNKTWFASAKFDVRKKDAITNCLGKWIVEYPECETLSKYGHSAVKQFISSGTDRVQLNYQVYSDDFPRTSVLWGTTNKNELELLNDTSGSRRFAAFRVNKIKISKLRDRQFLGQLWAEAMFLFTNKGEKWWFDQDEAAARDRLNRKFRTVDVWEERIDSIIYERAKVWVQLHRSKKTPTAEAVRKADAQLVFSVQDVVHEFGLELARVSPRELGRITDAIKHLGCEPYGHRKTGGGKINLYKPGKEYLQNVHNVLVLNDEKLPLDLQDFTYMIPKS
jgi:predicted P-loop ATPase